VGSGLVSLVKVKGLRKHYSTEGPTLDGPTFFPLPDELTPAPMAQGTLQNMRMQG
jgi:hypothetical protein